MSLVNGRKWVVEHLNDATIDIEIEKINQTVFVSSCKKTVIRVRNKCNNIIIQNCETVEIQFQTVIASLEAIHSKGIKIICSIHIPTITVDSVDKIMIDLPATSLDTQILSCRSTEMNVRWPDNSSPEGYIERPLPQQFYHRIEDMSISTVPARLY